MTEQLTVLFSAGMRVSAPPLKIGFHQHLGSVSRACVTACQRTYSPDRVNRKKRKLQSVSIDSVNERKENSFSSFTEERSTTVARYGLKEVDGKMKVQDEQRKVGLQVRETNREKWRNESAGRMQFPCSNCRKERVLYPCTCMQEAYCGTECQREHWDKTHSKCH